MESGNFNLKESLTNSLGFPLAKLLLKTYFGVAGEVLGSGLLDVAKNKITDYHEQRKTVRLFESISDKVVGEIAPVLEKQLENIEAGWGEEKSAGKTLRKNKSEILARVADALSDTLYAAASTEFLIDKNLEPAQIEQDLQNISPSFTSRLSEDEKYLFNLGLSDAVRYLVNIVDSLPGFEVGIATESLNRLSRIQGDLDYTIAQVNRILIDTSKLVANNSDQRYESDYRQYLLRNLDYLELLGINVEPESKHNRLSVGYVSLNLEHNNKKGPPHVFIADELFRNLHTIGNRLLLRGEAGSGKSTLFRWIAIMAAQDFRGKSSIPSIKTFSTMKKKSNGNEPHINRIPFLLRLRDFSEGHLPTPDEFPLYIAKHIGQPPQSWVSSILRQGRGLVLLDGVDEVPKSRRETIKVELKALIGTFPNNIFIVSTRPTAVSDKWLSAEGFSEAHINPMSAIDREHFIDRWHEAVSAELKRQGKIVDLATISSELKSTLLGNPQIARLASNPLLCAAICALHRDRGKKLPQSQSSLCEALCEMLLHRRDEESGIDEAAQASAYSNFHYDQKRALIQHLAHHMVLNEESVLDYQRTEDILGQQLSRFPGHSADNTETIPRILIERSGLLRENRPGKIDFVHNTLKDYLAADCIVHDHSIGLLFKRCLDPTWQPVILFAVATRHKSFASEFVSKVLKKAQGNENKIQPAAIRHALDDKTLRRYVLLAIRCRAVALHLNPEIDSTIREIQESIFPPQNMSDAEALADCGNDAVSLLKYSSEMDENSTAASVRTLRLIGTKDAYRYLLGYKYDSRLSVVSELVQSIDPFEVHVVQDYLLSGKPFPDFVRRFIRDISLITKFTDLEYVNLSGTKVEDLSPLNSLKNLTKLSLANTPVLRLDSLSKNTDIQFLDISRTKINDISPLSKLVNLRTLNATDSEVKDLSPLSVTINLESLKLARTKVSSINPLSPCKNLVEIDLAKTQVNNLEGLLECKKLASIDISFTGVIDVIPLMGLPNLNRTNLSGLEVAGEQELANKLHRQWS
ncbi:MAG: NACHT domain-containing protein [Gammaproteobacteria bacterium]|nr:NACHT domain-containing protein [Gammaproteobacteria bacterium]MCF6260182.1 NACHT domain-containing protein [Gammaproteobacteria bacterium]